MFLTFIQRVAPVLLAFCLPVMRSPIEVVMPANAPLAASGPRPQLVRASAKVGRNEPCPCQSGKKHKHCCGA